MIELMILGFLAEGPLHGYELRRRMERLHGHARRISDGTVYPAIKRLVAAGYLVEQADTGTGRVPRKTLFLTDAGRGRLETLLREADGQSITHMSSFFVVLAFLSHLPDENDRRAVLQRRLDYLEKPSSFFFDGDEPLTSATVGDPYRRGIFLTARAASTAQRTWLREMLGTDGDTEKE
ncbi:PadR family transcriptional regulator [Corynebacterium variabile]|uniref:PadR family transcriptional regulator n=1 Tax=Corynebacterium variabile TaxID=1727 RepID=UPI003736488F